MEKPVQEKFNHRDINWLEFNKRVLQEAADKRNPVYERLKFLAIFSSNLDEYYRVRVSQLRHIKKIKKSLRKKLALKPSKKVKQIIREVKSHQRWFGEIFNDEIIPELKKNGIYLIEKHDFSSEQKAQAESYFDKAISAELTPKIVDLDGEKNIFLENNTIYFFVTFEDSNEVGLVNIPVENQGRFFEFESNKENHYITFIDDILRAQMDRVFPEKQPNGIYEIKMSRDAELYLEDEFHGVLSEKIYVSLKKRTSGQATRLLYDASIPKPLQKKLRKYLGLGKIDMMPGGKYHNFRDFLNFPDFSKNKSLFYKDLPPIPHKAFEQSKDYFETIRAKDRLLHFPYMSFSYVENFVLQAAEDENTTSIKISLYRVADKSKLTSALMKASKNGIKVTIFIEAKARFDEKNNIDWGRKFEKNGARVIYSYPKIKVHSKILLVERKEGKNTESYAYIGTGNFNSQTSKIYCDHAMFTNRHKITKELRRVFRVLEGELIIPRTKNLLVSPFNTRRVFTKLILTEIQNAEAGKPAKITAKMNSLEDKEIIELLYRASQKGVKIRLLVRGFTCLIAGKAGLSENIYMTSIVDRFLEHGRIYHFENDGDDKLFFGSADWMTRNLDRRIEVLAPVYDEDVAEELKHILNLQLHDNVKARIQDYTLENQYVSSTKTGSKKIRSQYAIYAYLKKKHA